MARLYLEYDTDVDILIYAIHMPSHNGIIFNMPRGENHVNVDLPRENFGKLFPQADIGKPVQYYISTTPPPFDWQDIRTTESGPGDLG